MREDGHSSLPQAFDELVHTVKAKSLVWRIADVHRNVLRVELILRDKTSITCTKKMTLNGAHPEVPPARQACQTNDLVICLA